MYIHDGLVACSARILPQWREGDTFLHTLTPHISTLQIYLIRDCLSHLRDAAPPTRVYIGTKYMIATCSTRELYDSEHATKEYPAKTYKFIDAAENPIHVNRMTYSEEADYVGFLNECRTHSNQLTPELSQALKSLTSDYYTQTQGKDSHVAA